MKVMVIAVIVGVLRTVPKGYVHYKHNKNFSNRRIVNPMGSRCNWDL